MRARVVMALFVFVLAAAGCGSSSTPPPSVTIAPVEVMPSGAQEVTSTVPAAGSADCVDREASLRPGPQQPAPGAMPPGSTMAAIAERGRLIVGVDQNTKLFGERNPSTGQLEGFDIDVAREFARATRISSSSLRLISPPTRKSLSSRVPESILPLRFRINGCARRLARPP